MALDLPMPKTSNLNRLKLDIATRIAAGIAANPADAYVQAEVAAKKAATMADVLLEECRERGDDQS